MSKPADQSFYDAVRELIVSADSEPTPDTIALPDTPENRELAAKLAELKRLQGTPEGEALGDELRRAAFARLFGKDESNE